MIKFKTAKLKAIIFLPRPVVSYAVLLGVIFAQFCSFLSFPLSASAAALSRPPNNLGLVGYWGFDEGKGTKAGDRSGNGNTGTLTGATWTDGKLGKALSFSGSGRATITNTPSLNNYANGVSVSLWFKTNSVSAWQGPFGQNGPGYMNFWMNSGSGSTLLRWETDAGQAINSATAIYPNVWYHAVGVYDTSLGSNQAKMYINGVLDAQGTKTFTTSKTANVIIGDYGAGEFPFNGLIDEVRIYNRALGASEIASLYRAGGIVGKQSSKQGLVGYWPLNEGRGSKAGDFSGNGSNCTFYGSPSWTSGPRGSAINFPASTDYMLCGNNSVLNTGSSNFTLSAWVSRASSTSASIIMGKRAYPPGYIIYFSGTSLVLQVNDASPIGYNLGSFAEINTWRLITVVVQRTTNQAFYYLDGVLQSTTALSAATGSTDNAGNFGISADGSDTVNPLRGKIDDVRIYNRALSAAEVRALFGEGETQINSAQNNFLTSGLVGLWSFNGQDYNAASTTAEVLDRSSSGLNGDNTGAKRAIGKVGQALEFSGGSEYVGVAGNSIFDLSRGTIAGWFKFDDMSGGVDFSAGGSWVDERFVLHFGHPDDGKIKFTISNGSSYDILTSNLSPLMGRWYHIAATYDGTNKKIYVNGELDNSAASSITPATTSVPLYIGKTLGLAPDNSDGVYDEVRVYSRALSADEIKQLYNAGK